MRLVKTLLLLTIFFVLVGGFFIATQYTGIAAILMTIPMAITIFAISDVNEGGDNE